MLETLPDPVEAEASAPSLTTIHDADETVNDDKDNSVASETMLQEQLNLDDFAPAPIPPFDAGENAPPVFNTVKEVTGSQPATNVKYNKDGSIAKPRGRKPGQKSAASPATVSKEDDTAAVYGTALAVVDIATSALAALIGPEWKPEKGEAEELAGYGAVYMRSLGMTDPPPGIVFMMAIAGYAARRAHHQNTLDKIKAVGIRFYLWGKNLINRSF